MNGWPKMPITKIPPQRAGRAGRTNPLKIKPQPHKTKDQRLDNKTPKPQPPTPSKTMQVSLQVNLVSASLSGTYDQPAAGAGAGVVRDIRNIRHILTLFTRLMTRAKTTEGSNTHYSSTENWANMTEKEPKDYEYEGYLSRKDEFIAPMLTPNF